MIKRLALAVCFLAACGPVEKKKSDDPTVVAEDLDQPEDLTIAASGAFWTTRPNPVSSGGSGKPSSIQTVGFDGGEVNSLLTDLKQASALTNDGRFLYWFDQKVDKRQLNKMSFQGGDSIALVSELADPPGLRTRLLPFGGKLYWGGIKYLWSVSLDGGPPQKLLVARDRGGNFELVTVDSSGLYFIESNASLGRDLKRVSLLGAYEPEPPDAGVSDAGSSDAGASDAGASDAGASDAGPGDAGMPGYPAEAPGVELLRRGSPLNSSAGPVISGAFIYWINGGLAFGGKLVRAPLFNAGDDETLYNLPGNTSATDLQTEGGEIIFALESNAGGGIYRFEDGERVELYRLNLLSGGTPRDLRLDRTHAWFFAGGERGARLHRVIRHAVDAGVADARMDAGADAGP